MKFPLTFSLNKIGLPLIITSGKLKNLCFLIDTGATHNFLFTYVYEHFKDEFKNLDGKQFLMGIEGHCKETSLQKLHLTLREMNILQHFPFLMQMRL